MRLGSLKVGQAFRVVGCPELTGTVARIGAGSVTVKVDGGVEEVPPFTDRHGDERGGFQAHKRTRTTWSCGTLVELVP